MGSVSATCGPDTELQVPDEILQNFGMKTSFSKDVPKLSKKKTRMTGPDCAVMCNLINIHTYIHTYIHTFVASDQRFS